MGTFNKPVRKKTEWKKTAIKQTTMVLFQHSFPQSRWPSSHGGFVFGRSVCWNWSIFYILCQNGAWITPKISVLLSRYLCVLVLLLISSGWSVLYTVVCNHRKGCCIRFCFSRGILFLRFNRRELKKSSEKHDDNTSKTCHCHLLTRT